ncbi:MAG: outer membrane protein assembly factor BamD [Bacteroidia bacterium]|nr:outer membrane protein assembly factor BamD [Bacteroidia bacterium]
MKIRLKSSGFYFFVVILMTGLLSCSKEVRVMNKYAKKGTIAQKDSAAAFFYKRKDWDKSSILMEELIGIMKTTPRGEEMMRDMAFAKFMMKEYVMASYYYDQFLRSYPNGKYAEDASFMESYCFYLNSDPSFLDQSYTTKAMESLQNFLNNYPKSARAGEASKYLTELRERKATKDFNQAKLYFDISNHKAAVYSLQTFVQEFPDSKFREEAEFMIVKAAVLLADQSIESKQVNRYKDAVEYYEKFIDRYPKSFYRKDAELIYEKARKALEKIGK